MKKYLSLILAFCLIGTAIAGPYSGYYPSNQALSITHIEKNIYMLDIVGDLDYIKKTVQFMRNITVISFVYKVPVGKGKEYYNCKIFYISY